ncbi:[NiFe] hydrogenase metallocenter assembly protein HypC [hydrothermal vent metagenome]|uniref:[NiFe] hydrogenase metallocenter assembly protein HypC n=1 Tax=hydrothermal vent metagenome TaxID=652676 RepID=A0A3B0R9N8_9ZZZZ
MCLGVPGKVIKINGDMATVELGLATVEVSIQLLEGGAVGEYVIVHAGFAIERLDPEAARKTLDAMISFGGSG